MPIIVAPAEDLLCTVAEAKEQLNKTSTVDDGELLDYCKAVTKPIEQLCGEILPATVTNEVYRSVTGSTLVLRAERVISVTSITGYTGTTYTQGTAPDGSSGTFLLDPASGLVTLNANCFSGDLTVTYVAGMSPVDPAINLAARIIVANLWETQQGGSGLPDVYGDEPAPSTGYDVPIPPRARMLLQPFMRAPRVR